MKCLKQVFRCASSPRAHTCKRRANACIETARVRSAADTRTRTHVRARTHAGKRLLGTELLGDSRPCRAPPIPPADSPLQARRPARTHLLEVAVVNVGVHPEQALEYGAHGLGKVRRERGAKLGREDAAVVDLRGRRGGGTGLRGGRAPPNAAPGRGHAWTGRQNTSAWGGARARGCEQAFPRGRGLARAPCRATRAALPAAPAAAWPPPPAAAPTCGRPHQPPGRPHQQPGRQSSPAPPPSRRACRCIPAQTAAPAFCT